MSKKQDYARQNSITANRITFGASFLINSNTKQEPKFQSLQYLDLMKNSTTAANSCFLADLHEPQREFAFWLKVRMACPAALPATTQTLALSSFLVVDPICCETTV
ncbi:hypothetical protein [Ruegeria lacuscaerulensis]|uniref:hypothetical protein n=1 Tax=Ruegeria lacuscaerulensis TaxID=55218 RepID=UPI00147B2C7A|nr:hypothetical protein [Ruegeria lacuscaerulensis]